jgi:hypothetical protein
MLSIGRRVKYKNPDPNFGNIQRGTVTKASPMGYIRVEWDTKTCGNFSPMAAATELIEVTGDDALPRHVWDFNRDAEYTWCAECFVEQTDENEFGACKGHE